jgi:predicted PurR-regulated permease PerM
MNKLMSVAEGSNRMKLRPTHMFLALLTLGAVFVCFLIVQPWLVALATAGILAIAFRGLHRRILQRMERPDVSALLATLGVVLLVAGPIALLSVQGGRELQQLYQSLSVRNGGQPTLAALDRVLEQIARSTGTPAEEVKSVANRYVADAAEWLLQQISRTLASAGSGVIQLVVAFLALFFLFRDGASLRGLLARWLPLPAETQDELIEQLIRTINANVNGVLVVGTAQGTATALALWLLGVPSPLLLGLMAAAFSVLPIIGPAVVWVPSSLFLLATGQVAQGLILLAVGAGFISFLDNLLRPLVLSGQLHLHPLLVFLALLGGTGLFGPIGIFLGPAMMAVTFPLLKLTHAVFFPAEPANAKAGSPAVG